jgi:hypothetical protein
MATTPSVESHILPIPRKPPQADKFVGTAAGKAIVPAISDLAETTISEQTCTERFLALFPSSDRAYTRGTPGASPLPGKKAKWSYTTLKVAFGPAEISAHLGGSRSIVAIPILGDSTCRWGAIDYDKAHLLNFPALEAQIKSLGLPLQVFESKSHGAHLFVLFTEPQSTRFVQNLLKIWAKQLDFPEDTEIFPKQERLENLDAVGNGINLPFFGAPKELETFTPVYCDPSQWKARVESAERQEPIGTQKTEVGFRLREGWDPEVELTKAGLQYDLRRKDNLVYFDYHAEMGTCLLQGSAHADHANLSRQSTFVWNTATHRFYHQCFDSDCRSKTNKTSTALLSLGINVADIAVDPDFDADLNSASNAAENVAVKLLSHSGLIAQREAAGSMPEIIEGLLPDKTVNIIAGDSGLGKSPLMVQMAICAAFGIPFLGRETRRGRVLIVDYENPDILDRLNDIGGYLKIPLPMDEQWLRVVQNPTQKEVLAAIEHFHPLLVVVDGLRGYDSRMEKNLDGAAAEVLNRCQVAAMTHGLAWMFIHNVRKASEDFKVDLFDPSIRVMEWLETVAGSRSLINQTFVRIGIEQVKKVKGEEVLGARGFYKGKGEFGPIKIGRKFDDNGQPIGYYLVRGESLLSEDDRAHVARLPVGEELSFSQVKNLAEFKSDQPVSDFLKRCEAAGVIGVQGKARSKRRRYLVAAAIVGADPSQLTADDLPFD